MVKKTLIFCGIEFGKVQSRLILSKHTFMIGKAFQMTNTIN